MQARPLRPFTRFHRPPSGGLFHFRDFHNQFPAFCDVQGMNDTALQRFAEYRALTNGDIAAAAQLTLADAIHRQLDAREVEQVAPPAVLTAKQAAARLGVGAVYDLIDAGQLPCQRIGKGRGIRATLFTDAVRLRRHVASVH